MKIIIAIVIVLISTAALAQWISGGNSCSGATYIQLTEIVAPAAPPENSVRIYAVDDGGGKTRLMALFHTGVAQPIATEP